MENEIESAPIMVYVTSISDGPIMFLKPSGGLDVRTAKMISKALTNRPVGHAVPKEALLDFFSAFLCKKLPQDFFLRIDIEHDDWDAVDFFQNSRNYFMRAFDMTEQELIGVMKIEQEKWEAHDDPGDYFEKITGSLPPPTHTIVLD